LLLIALAFSTNLHGLSHIDDNHHSDENANCELCIIANTEEKVFVGIMPCPISFSTEDVIIALNNTNLITSAQLKPSKKQFKSDHFNKPPPASIS